MLNSCSQPAEAKLAWTGNAKGLASAALKEESGGANEPVCPSL